MINHTKELEFIYLGYSRIFEFEGGLHLQESGRVGGNETHIKQITSDFPTWVICVKM